VSAVSIETNVWRRAQQLKLVFRTTFKRFIRNELDGLPYLDAFVHEVMRIFSPVPTTRRDAIKEATIPLGHPIMGRNGQMMDSIVVPKDTPCMLGESWGLW
jgi:hypothetical protein